MPKRRTSVASALPGASNKTVKAKNGAKNALVAFMVTAQDDEDGAVRVTCMPKSGLGIPLDKTKVTCSPDRLERERVHGRLHDHRQTRPLTFPQRSRRQGAEAGSR